MPDLDPTLGTGDWVHQALGFALTPESGAEVGGHAQPQDPLRTIAATPPIRPDAGLKPRTIARRIYLHLRPRHPNPAGTLRAVYDALLKPEARAKLPPQAPPADLQLLTSWAVDDAWERAYENTIIARALELPGVQQAQRLEYLVEMRDGFQQRVEHLQRLLSSDNPEQVPTRLEQESLRDAWRMLQETDAQIERLEEQLRRQRAESMAPDLQPEKWRVREQELYEELTVHYQGRGPVYENLCKQLAEITVRVEQLRDANVVTSTGDYTKLHQLRIQTIGQLQRFTEATKSEALTKQSQEVGLGLMRIVEGVVAPRAPELYNEIVQAVRASLTVVPTTAMDPAAPKLLQAHRAAKREQAQEA